MLTKTELDKIRHNSVVQLRKADYWTRKIYDCAIRLNPHNSKIKLTFKEPTRVPKGNYLRKKPVLSWVFSFFLNRPNVFYAYSNVARYGQSLSKELLSAIKKVEGIQISYSFNSFEEFKAKFNTRFISEQEILGLWDKESSQTGSCYDKRDFKRMGRRGVETMKKFCNKYHDLGTKTEYYQPSIFPATTHDFVLSEYYHSYHHKGRDITIIHHLGCPYITYSSEFHNYGNGSYYLIANKREVLHLEND